LIAIDRKYKEIIFQILVHLIVFVFFAIERNKDHIQPFKYVSFLNYSFAAFIINYFWLPLFYKSKNVITFIASVLGSILLSVLIEEFIVEQLFFSGTRAESVQVFYAFVDIIPIVSILLGLKFAWDAFGKQKEVERLEILAKNSELQFLKSQINPHFLFNNLNNLYAYSLEGSPKTPQIILELSEMLRYMLYDCRDKFVNLKTELEHLENFVSLYTLQIENRGQISMSIDKSVPDLKIAPLILIIFIENAFKHSQNSQSSDIKISIKVKVNDHGILNFKCENSYANIVGQINNKSGIGLENVKKRLQLIYPDSHTLAIEKKDSLYQVNLSINLRK